jgi:cytochrome c5
MRRELTEAERSTIINGLRVAAERFKRHAQSLQMARCPHCQDRLGYDGFGRTCRTCHGSGGIPDTNEAHARLAKQFASQHADSLALARLIEDADTITIHYELRTEALAL